MSWFADLAGRAESLLNNLDEQTGAALRNHNVAKPKASRQDKIEFVPQNEPSWGQKKRYSRSAKKTPVTETKSNYAANRKSSPTCNHLSRSPTKESQDTVRNNLGRKKSPTRKSAPQHNTLNKCPKTMVGDVRDTDIVQDQYGLRQRRYSLPADLELINSDNWAYNMQNLEVENEMLKNELNVMNREVSDLLNRLRKTEDELSSTKSLLESSETSNHKHEMDKKHLTDQLDILKSKITELTTGEIAKYKEQNHRLETEVALLKDSGQDLENKLIELNAKMATKDSTHIKLDSELRHAQATITELKHNLERTSGECTRLERDWDAYKLRVKSMLHAKDKEIRALQEGFNLTEDTKLLMEQLENLKDERDDLSDSIGRVRAECDDMKGCMQQMEQRHSEASRVVGALRDALRDERAARNKAEAACLACNKELKTVQMETSQTVADLRNALRDQLSELNQLREVTSSSRSNRSDTSALNVADYDVLQDAIDNEKIRYLTQTLVQRQGKVDSLLADNNMLRIQLEKIETKYKSEVSALRAKPHSVVQMEERSRGRRGDSVVAALSLRMAAVVRRHPLFRVLIVVYMVGLHLWVIAVLLTSSPDNYVRSAKS